LKKNYIYIKIINTGDEIMDYIELSDGKTRINYYEIIEDKIKIHFQDDHIEYIPYSMQKEKELLNQELNQMITYVNGFKNFDFDACVSELKLRKLGYLLLGKFKQLKNINEEINNLYSCKEFVASYTLFLDNMSILESPIEIVDFKKELHTTIVTPNNIDNYYSTDLKEALAKQKSKIDDKK
jgi:hypothetical protein